MTGIKVKEPYNFIITRTTKMDLKFVTIETFIIQFVILILVLYVLNKLIWKPYLAYLDEWETKQNKLEDIGSVTAYKNFDYEP